MGARVAVWLDDELEQRIDRLLEEMQKRPSIRDLGVTKSAVIKAALTKGLPFMELDHLPLGTHNADDLHEWMDETFKWLAQWYDMLDWNPDESE